MKKCRAYFIPSGVSGFINNTLCFYYGRNDFFEKNEKVLKIALDNIVIANDDEDYSIYSTKNIDLKEIAKDSCFMIFDVCDWRRPFRFDETIIECYYFFYAAKIEPPTIFKTYRYTVFTMSKPPSNSVVISRCFGDGCLPHSLPGWERHAHARMDMNFGLLYNIEHDECFKSEAEPIAFNGTPIFSDSAGQ